MGESYAGTVFDAQGNASLGAPARAHFNRPDARKVGMLAFLASEAAFFSTLLVAYASYLGKSTDGPTPQNALRLPLVIGTTICLLSSSVTVHQAVGQSQRQAWRGFAIWWSTTIALGITFLSGTAYEWHILYWHDGLTPQRNLFGTTYYTLVGFHALHVTMGVVVMIVLLALAWVTRRDRLDPIAYELTSWYWHFVDGVWIVVFLLVYVFGR